MAAPRSLSLVVVRIATICLITTADAAAAFVPFIDGGKEMPALYKGWFDDQIAKQASTAVSKAVSAGQTTIEVNFPPVPNVEEVRFGTPLNQKFGTTVVAKDLKIPGGYKPGSDISRNLIAYSNIYWAKKIAPSIGGGGGPFGRPVSLLSAEPVDFRLIQAKGDLSKMAPLSLARSAELQSDKDAFILVNPGGEETWERIRATCCGGSCSPSSSSSSSPFVILNNAYSTTYDLGNKQRGYEEAYYLKRISKGWVFRAFPGPWLAYLERPDGTVELLESYKSKPSLKEVATQVREESFRRYAINNDRWSPGFGERL